MIKNKEKEEIEQLSDVESKSPYLSTHRKHTTTTTTSKPEHITIPSHTTHIETTTVTSKTISTPNKGAKTEINREFTKVTKQDNKDDEIIKKSDKQIIHHDSQVNPDVDNDGKPIWMKKNLLKKPSENTRTTNVVRSTPDKKDVKKLQNKTKDVENLDCVTSSYGVGPTDENGRPLFGIRALKKQTQKVTEEVKGIIKKI